MTSRDPEFTELTRSLVIRIAIASVWIYFGLICKVLGLAPSHFRIVERILNTNYAEQITVLIGAMEVVMAFWVLSGYSRRLNAAVQVTLVLAMNVIETVLAVDLLLFGRFNLLISILFASLVLVWGFRKPATS
ncbi:MAG: DoxX-like family protein [Myxococcota bacterium]